MLHVQVVRTWVQTEMVITLVEQFLCVLWWLWHQLWMWAVIGLSGGTGSLPMLSTQSWWCPWWWTRCSRRTRAVWTRWATYFSAATMTAVCSAASVTVCCSGRRWCSEWTACTTASCSLLLLLHNKHEQYSSISECISCDHAIITIFEWHESL